MVRFLLVCAALALLPPAGMAQTVASGGSAVHDAARMNSEMETFFRTLQRPGSPNHWLVAPADFVVKPDAVAPVFAVPVAVLAKALKTVMHQTKGAAIHAEMVDGLHVVVTSAIFSFKDDVRIYVIPLSSRQSTLAVYSASRVGYWDLGANRRRVEDWLTRLQVVLSAPQP
jgi:uncharacterized protein (DUF1499 family)